MKKLNIFRTNKITMRVDKKINHNKVAKDVLLNPLKTQRERAEDL